MRRGCRVERSPGMSPIGEPTRGCRVPENASWEQLLTNWFRNLLGVGGDLFPAINHRSNEYLCATRNGATSSAHMGGMDATVRITVLARSELNTSILVLI